MSLPFRMLAVPAVITALALQLGGCGEGSNNLADPQNNETPVSGTGCSPDPTKLCTSGQFIDEPVVGLNYECDNIKSVTDEQGFFSCPDNTMVSFYLLGKNSERRINLGKYRVKPLGDLSGGRLDVLLQITPRDLLGYTDLEIDTNTLTGIQLANVLRLLQALDSDSYDADNQAINRIVLASEDKDQLGVLTKDIEIGEFAVTESIENSLAPFLTVIKKTLPTPADAIARFNKSVAVLQSGVFEVAPFAVGKVSNGVKSYSGMIGFSEGAATQKLMDGMVLVVDRDQKAVGLGVEWQGAATDEDLELSNSNTLQAQLIQRFMLDQAPKFLKSTHENIGFEANGALKPDFSFTDTSDGSTLKITSGAMYKKSMSGGEFFYRNVYGLAGAESIPENSLGKWERRDINNVVTFKGTVNMNQTRNTSPYLDPAIWRIAQTIDKGVPTFPLHLKLTLRNSDTSNSICDPERRGCLLGTIGITIRDDGNIVSDRNNDCSIPDKTTMMDALGIQEHRLGMVVAAFESEGQSYISPVILIGGWANELGDADPWKNFYGVQLGMTTAVGGPKVKINVTNAPSKFVSITDNQTENSTDAARWVSYTKTFKFIHKNANGTRNVAVEDTQGPISRIETQACYNPVPKS